MPASRVSAHQIIRLGGEATEERPDLLAVEEPLEIRLEYGPLAKRKQFRMTVTMRTPGEDEALALGFLHAEGIIQSRNQVRSARTCGDPDKPESEGNILRIILEPEVAFSPSTFDRNVYTHASCGVCGKTSLEAVFAQTSCVLPAAVPMLKEETLFRLATILREKQAVFAHTGGLHAAALFSLTGELRGIQEDIGRHNALDKVIGKALVHDWLPLSQHVLLLSGRIGFELVQKALMAGIPIVAAIGAPSSLAVQLAEQAGITLIGFLKKDRCNIYTSPERVIF